MAAEAAATPAPAREPLGSRTLKVGVLGCGQIAVPHLQTLAKRCGAVELTLCDLRPGAAQTLAEQTGVSASCLADPEHLLAAGLDVVHVTTPPGSHFELTKRALEAGCHVLVEKPPAFHESETRELFDLAERSGRMLCVDHSALYMPCVRTALDRIASGALGRPIHFHCYYGHADNAGTVPYGGPAHWAYRMPGGVLLNLASHPACLLVETLGVPDRVSAHLSSRNVMPDGVPDLLEVSAESQAGFGSFTISMGHGNADRRAIFWCEGGTITVDLSRQVCVVSRHRGSLGVVDKVLGGVLGGLGWIGGTLGVIAGVATGRLQRDPGLRILVEAFYEALRSGGPAPVSAENAIGVARIVDASLTGPDRAGVAP